MAAFEVIALDPVTPQLRAPGAADTYTFPRASAFSAAITYGGVTLNNAVTGTGNMVLSTSPVLTTPNLGTPSAATLTNATGLPLTTGVTGLLPVANGGTGTATPSLVAGTNITISGSWPNQTINSTGGGGMTYPAAGIANSTGSAWGTSYSTSGTGTVVALTTSPTFTTPTLGVASATSINKVAFTAPATSATLTIADGKTFTINNSLTFSGTDSTTMTFPSTNATIARTDAAQTFTGTQTFSGSVVPGTNVVDSVGYTGMPQNAQSAAYTLVAADAGKTIVHPITDNNARTFTIPANGTVAFPVGTTITFINLINTVTIAITTDTMYLAGPGTTGSRTLAAYGIATAVKVSSTSWIISGNGLT